MPRSEAGRGGVRRSYAIAEHALGATEASVECGNCRGHRFDRFNSAASADFYIVDFICFAKRLIIELDGEASMRKARATAPDNICRRTAIDVLRIWNNELFDEVDGAAWPS